MEKPRTLIHATRERLARRPAGTGKTSQSNVDNLWERRNKIPLFKGNSDLPVIFHRFQKWWNLTQNSVFVPKYTRRDIRVSLMRIELRARL